MYLKHIGIRMKYGVREGLYCGRFHYCTYVIGYFLSDGLRKLKFETDGTFDAIIIQVGADGVSIGYDDFPVNKLSIVINLPFDFERYEKSDDLQRCKYYLELLQLGLQEISNFKTIPYVKIIRLANELAAKGFVYAWNFRNLILRDYNLKVKFISELSTNDFVLKLQAFEDKKKMPICEGQVARTKPDHLNFSYISKKIYIDNGRIIINDCRNRALLSIDIKSLMGGYLILEYAKSPYPENTLASETFYELQNFIKYDNNNFLS